MKLLSFESYYASHKPLLTTQHKKSVYNGAKKRKTGMMNGTKLYGQMSHDFPFSIQMGVQEYGENPLKKT